MLGCPDPWRQKLNQPLRVHTCLQQAGRDTLCRQVNDQRLALRGIAPSMLTIATNARFVTPTEFSEPSRTVSQPFPASPERRWLGTPHRAGKPVSVAFGA